MTVQDGIFYTHEGLNSLTIPVSQEVTLKELPSIQKVVHFLLWYVQPVPHVLVQGSHGPQSIQ